MEPHGSRKCGMKAIVETLASDKVITFYEKNKHIALGDAETLCRLSNFVPFSIDPYPPTINGKF